MREREYVLAGAGTTVLIICGSIWLGEHLPQKKTEPLGWAVLTGLIFSTAAIVFSWAWRRRCNRGPLEALMRRVAG